MSLALPKHDQTATTTTTRRRVVRNLSVPVAHVPRWTDPTVTALVEDRASIRTGKIFQALLGITACLALTGVVAQSQDSSTPASSPDAPPPAVFVQLD